MYELHFYEGTTFQETKQFTAHITMIVFYIRIIFRTKQG